MGLLSSADSVAANQTITVHWGGVLGPLTGTDSITQGISDAFGGTQFVLESVTIPTLSEIEPPVLVGHFRDVDGSGHSEISGRNLTEAEVESFILYRLQQVAGLYDPSILRIETGAQSPALFNSLGAINLTFVGIVLLALAVAVIIWKVWPA